MLKYLDETSLLCIVRIPYVLFELLPADHSHKLCSPALSFEDCEYNPVWFEILHFQLLLIS